MFWRRIWAWLNRDKGPIPLGQRGEEAAARFLKRQGWIVLHRRARNPLGELDLVVTDRRQVVFVEVKTTRRDDFHQLEDRVNRDKQRRIVRAAMRYLRQHGLKNYPVRFDVIWVLWPPHWSQPRIVHLPDAFQLPQDWD